jgi:tRNA(fMet)-specific endonuclease VapC
LDTSAYSHFKRGDALASRIIDAASWIGVPATTLGELRIGFLLGSQLERNEHELGQFMANSVVEVLPVDRDTADIYAEIVVDLRRSGTPIPTNDVWIAAAAIRAGASVLTYDPHFESIHRVGKIVLDDSAED